MPLLKDNVLKTTNNDYDMGIMTSIRKQEDKEDERTVSATEFINRLIEIRRTTQQQKEIPNTEMPKDRH